MSTLLIARPETDEAAPAYHGYIAKVPDGNLGDHLRDQLHELERLFAQVTDRAALTRYAEGKWSVRRCSVT